MTGGKILTSFWLGHLHGDYLPQPEQLDTFRRKVVYRHEVVFPSRQCV